MESYYAIPGLEHFYLEDSWVIAIDHLDGLRFKLEAVVTEDHPCYRPPKPEEQYCYRWLTIDWPASASINLEPSGIRPAVDATGAVDYGHIDSFEWMDARFELEGDFGRATVEGPPPSILDEGYVE